MTGWGAVANTAGVRAGQSAVVIGLGGVGLSVVQALRIVGATTIIAVDRSEEKLALARSMGATETLLSDETTVKAVRGLTGRRGADHAFDCVGAPATIRTAWSASRRGGSVTVVGIGSKDEKVEFSPLELFHFARTLRGCVYGSMDPARDVPILIEHLRSGALDLSALISDRIGLDGHRRGVRRDGGRRRGAERGGVVTAACPGPRRAGTDRCTVRLQAEGTAPAPTRPGRTTPGRRPLAVVVAAGAPGGLRRRPDRRRGCAARSTPRCPRRCRCGSTSPRSTRPPARWAWTVRVGRAPVAVQVDLEHGVLPRTGGGSLTWLTLTGPLPLVTAYAPLARYAIGRLVGA